jgi:undecaprenyl-diphosphatase
MAIPNNTPNDSGRKSLTEHVWQTRLRISQIFKPMKRPQQSSEHDKNGPLVKPDSISHDQGKTRLISTASLFVFTTCIILSFTGHAVDYPIMRFLNLFSRKHAMLDCSLLFLANNNLTSGIFLLSLIWYAWFCSTELHYRRRILVGTMGAAFSGIFSRVLQLTLPTHVRPLHDPQLNFLPPEGVSPDTLNHWNSFPSDHAAVFFGLVAVIFFSQAKLGYLAFVWTAIVSGGRIYLGYHYPTDVLAGAALGVISVSTLQGRFHLFESRLLSFEKRAAPAFYMTAFFVTYQIATLFDDLRELLAMPCIKAFFKRLLHL